MKQNDHSASLVEAAPPRASRRAIRLPAVKAKVSLSGSSVYAKEKAGDFPRRFRLGPNASAWWEHEVDAWLERRAQQPVEAPRTIRSGPGRPRKAAAPATTSSPTSHVKSRRSA